MNWAVALASVAGTAHADTGQPCQDFSSAVILELADGRSALAAALADGAGSALAGGDGARAACEIVLGVIEAWLGSDDPAAPDEATARGWLCQVHEALSARALDRTLRPSDLACTLLFVLATHERSLFVQVGDGAIVADLGDGLRPMTWPQTGEYANTTKFITDDDATQAALVHIDKPALCVALFSDGLQYLTLDYSVRTVHTPFFESMFSVLRTSQPGVDQSLCTQLGLALRSTRLNSATDDDKTLVIASQTADGTRASPIL